MPKFVELTLDCLICPALLVGMAWLIQTVFGSGHLACRPRSSP